MGMYRKPTPRAEALEQLTEERDHLKIQIHLAAERKKLDDATLGELRSELSELERKIDVYWRSVSKA